MDNDPTRIVNQPSLTVSTGRSWLIVGGIFTAIAEGVLIAMTALPPLGLALAAAIAIGLLYFGILVVRLTVRPGRRRLGMMAIGMLAIALISLVTATIVATTAVDDAQRVNPPHAMNFTA
ncbi:MAG: hypothetical protein EPN91_01765 [Salinibacterium sp.]|nr:MAG: hypothetical protein EPN91_01765 [Salinibacterium sp.]